MCGINASRGQEHGCRFTMCHASLKMALLLHKEGLVKTTVPTTVGNKEMDRFINLLRSMKFVFSTDFFEIICPQNIFFNKFIDFS